MTDLVLAAEDREPAGGTRLIQRDAIRWRLPGMGLFGRPIVTRHIGEQHGELKGLLETTGSARISM